MFELLRRDPTIENGTLTIDEKPGAGFDLNWEMVEKFAVQTQQYC